MKHGLSFWPVLACLICGCTLDPWAYPPPKPTNLTYSQNPTLYTIGQAIAPNTLSSEGGPADSYRISPSLPMGLIFSTTTGTISGTPRAIAPLATYTVTATNSGGSSTVSLTIAVADVSPGPCAYSTNPASYRRGQPITSNPPSCAGGAVISYAVTPSLPVGLRLDTTTGVISGTPTALSPLAAYVVTVTNSSGFTTVTLAITVNDAPGPCSYSTNPASYRLGQAIVPNVLSCAGGAIVSYDVSPSLPVGLSLNTTTGVISGTPTTVTPSATYAVTATNSDGSFTVALPITVTDVPPGPCSYSTNPASYRRGQAIANNVPSCAGGPVVSWSVSPTLPADLSLNTTTGVISGTPTAVTPSATYTVTATNSGGSTTVALPITITDAPPAGCSYSTNPASYRRGQAITNNTPSCSGGGAVVSWSISPTLPTGLSFNTTTGVISGTPTTLSPTTTYSVSAINSGGSLTFGLTLTVTDIPPTGCSYLTNPASYRLGQAITNNVPSCGGGAVVSYSVSPALPSGLSFNTTTGVISGTPTAVTPPSVAYTVTAINSGGSATVSLVMGVKFGDVVGTGGIIAAGQYHTCALVDGGARCWGANADGELGNGSTSGSGTPVQVTGLSSGVQALSAGTNHTCALVNGGARCWGFNGSGQLGNGSNSSSPTPVPVTGLATGVQAVTTGTNHSCALVDGGVRCWGYNYYGQLGNGSNLDSPTPVPVTGLDIGVQAIAAGTSHTCALVNGGVRCWGANGSGQLGNGFTSPSSTPVQVTGLSSGVLAIAAGNAHTCALLGGSVRCWGSNVSGQLGDGSTTSSSTPVTVATFVSGVQAIVSRMDHTCVLASGGAQCWGANSNGQLGTGSAFLYASTPRQVTGLSSGVLAIAAGGFHSCAVIGGGVQCWGANGNGQVGDGYLSSDRLTPVFVTGLATGVQSLAAGGDHACALASGGARCWGYNVYGQLGNGSLSNSSTPLPVTGLASGVQALAAGDLHTCAIVNGGARCWGFNGSGQLGNGSSTTNSSTPVAVTGLATGVQAIAAATSGHHTCALVDGGARCWGSNTYGELGNGSTSSSSTPVPVTGLSTGVQAIVAGSSHTCALVNGSVRCWGYNIYGQLGNGSTSSSSTPVPVTGLSTGVLAIVAGASHTCALVGGSVRCWGYNGQGQLGNGSTSDSSTPVVVTTFVSGVQALAAGLGHTCTLASGGAKCWGANGFGRLGDGSTNDSSTPIAVIGLASGVLGVAAGAAHSCALVGTGARCWGLNNRGQLGNGTITNSPTPVTVIGL